MKKYSQSHRWLAAAAFVLWAALIVTPILPSDCTKTSVGLIPLTELGTGTYKGRQGGLYPDGANRRPSAHEAAGLAAARSIFPLDARGLRDDAGGKIVFLSVGMSNTTQEFSTFKPMADADPAKNPSVIIVDGAQGGMTASVISNLSSSPGQQYWNTTDSRLAAAGVTPAQVQAAWLKEADAQPTAAFPNHTNQLKNEMAVIARILKSRYPNLRIVYLSSRIYAGYATTALNPEPYAYESGFAVKWLIEDQINGAADLNADPVAGPVKAPWLAWGPYLWADGMIPRADGLIYRCSDLNPSDGTHPAASGAREKVAGMLLDFLKNDSTAKPWYLRGSSLIFPALVGRNSILAAPMEKLFTGIALANLDSTAASITLTAFGRGGELLAGPGILNPATLPLAAGAQIARMDFEVFGDGIGSGAQVGWFQAESTSPGLHGFFLAFDGIVSVLDGTNASKQGTRSFVWPDLSDGDAFIETHIVNPWAEANEIRLQLFDSAGAMREGEIVFRLEANGALLEPLNEVFTTGLGSGDYLRVSAEREVVPLLLWGNRGRYLKALEGQAEENSATTLYAPQYVVGDMWRSTLSVVNLENVPGEVRLEFADRSGNSVTRTRPIAALGKIFIGDQDFFVDPRAGLRQGHVKITGSGMRLAGNVVFGDAEQLRSATALPLVSNLTSEMVFSQFVSNANYYTGVALLNPGDTGARGTVEVFGSDGARLASAPFVLAAGRSDAFVLSTLPELTGMSLSSGYIRIRADQPIAGFALFATHNNAAVSAIPPQSIR